MIQHASAAVGGQQGVAHWRVTRQEPRRPKRRAAVASASGGDGNRDRDGAQPSLPPPSRPPVPPQMSSRAVSTSLAGEQPAAAECSSSSSSSKDAVGRWAETYRAQQRPSGADSGRGAGAVEGAEFLLPVMTLSKVKLPTESVPLQIFEPRYRLLFKLVNQSASRRFGVVLASSGSMESVGALCELTHFVTVPERQRLFINARVVGRFETRRVVNDKPFVAVLAREHRDAAPRDVAAAAAAAALELRVWRAMEDVAQLAAKLFVGGERLGHDVFSLEARRWSPDAAARAAVRTAPGADPTLMRMVQLAGLLGDEASVAQRTTEYLCSDATRQVGEDERRERFSFALARTLDFGPERLQQLLYSQDTAERLRAIEDHVLEGRAYLAARSTLRDLF